MTSVSHAIQIFGGNTDDPRAWGPRMARVAAGFVTVVVAYWIYSLAMVPLIEPRADRPTDDSFLKDTDNPAIDQRIERIRDLFPSGSWQTRNPKILESGTSLVLFQGYRNFGSDGRVEITPCTVVQHPTDTTNPEEYRRRCVVLDAPDGAVLQFDRPMELGRGEFGGRLIGGRLNGQITVRSDGRSPGPEDDLRIITQNLELKEQTVSTESAVDFRLGASYGRGREMVIHLLSDSGDNSGSMQPGFSGLESFELRHVEQLHLEPAQRNASTQPPGTGGPPLATDLPIEISCSGPFRFNMLRQAATFEDRVDVLQIHPNGPSDRLTCNLLTIRFGDRRPTPLPNAPPLPATTPTDLEPRSFEADGEPAVITLPTQQAEGHAQHLEYDLLTGRISATGDRPITLNQGTNQIEAVKVESIPVGTGQFRQVIAQGPGRFRGQQNPSQRQSASDQIEATWQQQLLVQPIDQRQKVSLMGGAILMSPQFGSLEADQIDFLLMDTSSPASNPPSSNKNAALQGGKLQLDHMHAQKGVRLLSPQFSALTEQLDIAFEQAPSTATNAITPASAQPAASNPLALVAPQAGASAPAQPGDAAPAMPAQHFEISGAAIAARVILPPQQPSSSSPATGAAELAAVTVENNVRLVETHTAQPNDRPMLVTGDRLEAVYPAQPCGTVLVVGKPAHFEARGLGLTGSNINLNRGTNRLWIDGAGQMDLPMDRDMEGQPLANPGTLAVRWQSRMSFDGLKAQFEESVVAAGANAQLHTEMLEVVFRQKIQFNEPQNPQQQPDAEQILCRGGVWIENQSYQQQELTAIERIKTVDLAINRTSGAVNANGPGWVWRVMRGGANPMPGMPGAPVQATSAPAAPDNHPRCIFVQFQNSLTGNLRYRDLVFHGEVQTMYDAVEGWESQLDSAHPESLSLDGAIMNSNELEVRQMLSPQDNRPVSEMEARGNAVVESPRRGFTAQALRIAYSELNGLLTLAGDGRTDAVLSRQTTVGGSLSKTTAQRIFYWPATNTVRVEGARSLDMDQFSNPKNTQQ